MIVDVVFEEGLLFLSVANVGDRPALDVKTTFNRKLVGLGGTKDVAALALFRNISYLAPGQGDPDAARLGAVLVRAQHAHDGARRHGSPTATPRRRSTAAR